MKTGFTEVSSDAIDSVFQQHQFELISSNSYFNIFKQKDVMAVQVVQEYTPIEHFKATFNIALELIKENKVSTLFFDKTAMRTFHQPTMEWYYTEWKVEAWKAGVSRHLKVLPALDWFQKAVRMAKDGLDQQLNELTDQSVKIEYYETVEKAIAACISR